MRKLDGLIIVIFTAIFVMTYQYIDGDNRNFYLLFSGLMVVIFLYVFAKQPKAQHVKSKKSKGRIAVLSLLDEENNPVADFDIYGKVGVLLGKDKKDNSVDVNLTNSNYGSTVDYEHAVMNYADGAWYIEDLYSQNGVALEKKSDGRKYNLSPDKPCKVDFGDIIHIGLTKLLVR